MPLFRDHGSPDILPASQPDCQKGILTRRRWSEVENQPRTDDRDIRQSQSRNIGPNHQTCIHFAGWRQYQSDYPFRCRLPTDETSQIASEGAP
jgi:hypothetical protein